MSKKHYIAVAIIVVAAFVLGATVGSRHLTDRGAGRPPGVTSPFAR